MHCHFRKEYLIVPLLALALYLPCLTFDFAYDDLLVITQNPLITQGTEQGLRHVVTLFQSATPPGDLYRPLQG